MIPQFPLVLNIHFFVLFFKYLSIFKLTDLMTWNGIFSKLTVSLTANIWTSFSAGCQRNSNHRIPSSVFQPRHLYNPIHMALVPSSSMSSPKWSYDVFLSFSGQDTREGFTSHLYEALGKAGIHTFMDDRLSRGESISLQLYRKIEQSMFSIVVFSANYASSSWCLDELVKIMGYEATKEHSVIPIFYKVEPSEIRNQSGRTGEYLRWLSGKSRENWTKLGTWRAALTDAAHLSGFTFKEG